MTATNMCSNFVGFWYSPQFKLGLNSHWRLLSCLNGGFSQYYIAPKRFQMCLDSYSLLVNLQHKKFVQSVGKTFKFSTVFSLA